MLRFGITGKSGAGKSTVARLFEDYGVVHVDADKVAHSIYEPGTPCAAELVAHFGPGILGEDGAIDRRRLSAIVFSDPDQLSALSAITHRYVGKAIEEIEQKERAAGTKGLLIDAIALIEGGQKGSAVIAVTAPYALMLSRIMARDNISEADARRRLDAQKEEDFFVSHADYVVVNNGNTEALNEQVARIARSLGLCQ